MKSAPILRLTDHLKRPASAMQPGLQLPVLRIVEKCPVCGDDFVPQIPGIDDLCNRCMSRAKAVGY